MKKAFIQRGFQEPQDFNDPQIISCQEHLPKQNYSTWCLFNLLHFSTLTICFFRSFIR
ncbi:hypothetical protein STEG23_019607, partial [Scotinomys teguina]